MIKLKDVAKYYTSDSSIVMALRNINLEFRKGEFVAITGKSGGGKSTLLNVISGMDTYEDGEMYFQNMETSYYDSRDWENYRRENISFIYQAYNLIDSYTALENVEAVMMICDKEENKKVRKERRKKALEILDKVGLKKRAKHKAVHLSSGQKQRLGIARALAKDTDIIIADEPTGNLDVENGAAVMKMLYELSKERLVIVVTHNFEQVQEYASRKIRLFDGEIAEDIKLKPELYENGIFKGIREEPQEKLEIEKTKQDASFGKAVRFVKMNQKAQPHRTFFIFTILTAVIASFFVMYGYFLSSLDDTVTKEVSDEVFCNVSNKRLIVRKSDGSIFSDKDIEALNSLRYVSYVDKYDYANEISCLYEKDEDYVIEYRKSESSNVKSMTVDVKDYSDFIISAVSIRKNELTAGALPQGKYEVALASHDESLIGQSVDIYFKSKKWSDAVWLGGSFTITGIIDEELEKPCFSEELLKSMNVNYGKTKIDVNYNIEKKIVYDDPNQEDLVTLLNRKNRVILVEGEGLAGNQIRLSSAITMNIRSEGYEAVEQTVYENLYSSGKIKNVTDAQNEISYDMEVVSDAHSGSINVAEVSHEFLEQIYGSTDITQVSVYMDDYAYTDRVIKAINKRGYEAVSVYRISAGEYDSELVQERISSMMMSAASVVAIFVLSILVIYVIMRLKRRDFVILKMLGLQQKTINRMNYYELIADSMAITALLIIIFAAAGKYKIRAVSNLVKYYTVGDYIFVAALALCMSVITALLFNKYLNKFLGGKR